MNTRIALGLTGLLTLLLAAGCEKKDMGSGETAPATTTPDSSSISSTPIPPPQPKAEVEVQGVEPQEEVSLKSHLRVDGVLKQGPQYTAAINNQVVSVGDFIKLQVRSRNYNLEVLSITEERVLLKAVASP